MTENMSHEGDCAYHKEFRCYKQRYSGSTSDITLFVGNYHEAGQQSKSFTCVAHHCAAILRICTSADGAAAYLPTSALKYQK